MRRLEGKVALITGAASGMGAEDARLFAREGALVVALDIQLGRLQTVVDEILASGGKAAALELDVASEEQWQSVVQQAVAIYGRIDILVNNAAIQVDNRSVRDTTLEQWARVMDINALGVMLGMKHVIPEMEKLGKGSIINISSIGAIVGGMADSFSAAYSASKGAVRALTKHAAQVLASSNIRVNSIHPGAIKTPMLEDSLKDSYIVSQIQANFPLPPHIGDPLDIAYGALYLASDESKFVTGAELIIDGGFTSR